LQEKQPPPAPETWKGLYVSGAGGLTLRPAYYNEFDKYAAQWLRNLIAAGHIAPGDVDERSIEDVHPDDLRGYTQCHFFAGIGVWSYALRRAGWPDDRPVWTGSCPCQPFSAAGKGAGFDDERHLWPHWHWLIGERRPPVVFGEQVASKDAGPWIDLVHDDMEALDYAFGAVPFPSASVGAPHIRDRLYWLAYADKQPGRQGRAQHRGRHPRSDAQPWSGFGGSGAPIVLADASRAGLEGRAPGALGNQCTPAKRGGAAGGMGNTDGVGTGRHWSAVCSQVESADGQQRADDVVASGCIGWLADTDGGHASTERQQRGGKQRQQPEDGGVVGLVYRRRDGIQLAGPGKADSPWRDADWLRCRDGKWRPVEPSTFPLAHGAASRVGRLRAYGNAINAYQAQIFIEASMT
jgi:DNA (cytosine-5)-methyltransferase 1